MSGILRFLRIETFTGWHMVAVMMLFFGTIISVNLTLAYFANRSWSGLIVENTYVASQQFNEDVAKNRAMEARGWASDLFVEGGDVVYRLSDAAGTPVAAETATLILQRPVNEHDDRVITLAYKEGRYAAAQSIAPGQWVARVTVQSGDDTVYRETRHLWIAQPRVTK